MGRQRNNNRNYTYNTYDASPEAEDIISLIPAGAGEYGALRHTSRSGRGRAERDI